MALEVVIRDRKEGAGLAHLLSGRFAANAAWLAFSTISPALPRTPPQCLVGGFGLR